MRTLRSRASTPTPLRLATLFTTLLLLATNLAAQDVGRISGRVVTSDGDVVDDALVTLVSTRVQIRVDSEGAFAFEQVPAGEQLLDIESTRHAGGIERVTVTASETLEVIILLDSRVHSEQIVVSASPFSRGELDLAAPVNVLEGRDLAERLEPTIGETLAQEAGISSNFFTQGASRPIIRGLGGDRVKMMENGLDTLDASSSSPDHAVAADPLVAERVEVVRGPATLLYGSNAIGGVVNLLDGRIPDARATEPISGTLDLLLGSVAEERAAALNLNGGGGNWAWHVDFLSREAGDYDIPGAASLEDDEHQGEEHEDEEGHEDEEPSFGTVPNSDIDSTSGSAGATYFFDRGSIGVAVRGFDTEYGIPGGHAHEEEGHGHDDEDSDHDDEDSDHDDEGDHEDEEEHGEESIRIDMQQRRYDLSANITEPFGAFRGAKFRLGIVDYEHAELEGPEIGTLFFNDAWEGRLELVQKTKGKHTGSFGLQMRSRDFEAIGEEAFIPPAETKNLGIFTFQEFGDGPVRYQLGARFETQDTTTSAADLPDRDFDGLSASFGIVWQPSEGYSLGASLARSVKMPSSEELYSEGLHFATAAFELGDADLTEEASLGLDLTLRKVEGRVTGAFNLFRNEFSDYIFQSFTGAEQEGSPVLQWSQADAEFWGAEIDLSILLVERAHSSWDLDLLWDLVRAEFTDGGNLPLMPPQRLGIGLHYRGDLLRGGVQARFVDDQNRLGVNETPTDSFTMVNANVSYRFLFEKTFIDLILRGTNLTDEDARVHTSFVKNDVPLPGRNISVVLRLGF